MTLEEFDLEFDILYNNISSNKSPGLNALEKSIVLTQAQEILVKELYNGSTGDSFEKTEEVTEYLKTLVKQANLVAATTTTTSILGAKSKLFDFPDTNDCLYIIYEHLETSNTCNTQNVIPVVPVTHDEFLSTLKNPFRGPSVNRALRLIKDDKIELIYQKDITISKYTIRYIKKPSPIVLKNIEVDYEPFKDYINEGNNSELPDSLHRTILIKAVQIAKSLWQ